MSEESPKTDDRELTARQVAVIISALARERLLILYPPSTEPKTS